MLILEKLSRVRAITFLADTEMENAIRKNSIKDWSQQIRNAEKNNVVFNIQGTTRSNRKPRLGHVNFPQRTGVICAMRQIASKSR
jgi:hypothetical protein